MEVNYGIMTGQLDDDDILLKAQEVKLENAQIENGILKVTTNSLNDKIFDYDMQIRAQTDVVSAKMVRLFEFVTLEKNYLPSQFKILEEPIDEKKSLKVIKNIKPIEDTSLYEMDCPYDQEGHCIATFDGTVLNGKFNSNSSLKMKSSWKRKDLIDENILNNKTYIESLNITEEYLNEYYSMEEVGMASKKISKASKVTFFGHNAFNIG